MDNELTPLPISIRHAGLADFDAVVLCDPVAVTDERRQTCLRQAMADGSVMLAMVCSQVAGLMVLEHSFFGHAFISLVAVAPVHRRSGVALALLQDAFTRCGGDRLFTSTNTSNLVAQRLFQRADFQPSGSILNLDPDDPELVYVKFVNPIAR